MDDIPIGTIIRVCQKVFWKGQDIGGKVGIVTSNSSYIFAEIEGVKGSIKLFRHEVTCEPLDGFKFLW